MGKLDVGRGMIVTRTNEAKASNRSARLAIGDIEPGSHLFLFASGGFNFIDVIDHCLKQAGPSRLSIWTWGLGLYDADLITRWHRRGRVTSALLIAGSSCLVNPGARRGAERWVECFGEGSLGLIDSHAKIATIEGEGGMRISIRGSANLNRNQRIEQYDVSEGPEPFLTIRAAEAQIPRKSPLGADSVDVVKLVDTDLAKERAGGVEFGPVGAFDFGGEGATFDLPEVSFD